MIVEHYPVRHYIDSSGIKQCAIPLGGIDYLKQELLSPMRWISDIFYIKLDTGKW